MTIGLLLTLLVVQRPQPGPPPPEVRRTAEALVGEWVGGLTAIVPGESPETFPWSMTCRAAALGWGAACAMEGKASIGLLAESCLLAYAGESKTVHFMCVTSMGEVHDHKGRWTNEKTVEFESLQGDFMGKTVVETIHWSFPDRSTFETKATVAMPDGSMMRFEYAGRRRR
jgi:hypothetical protein